MKLFTLESVEEFEEFMEFDELELSAAVTLNWSLLTN